jgi:flavodoxin-like protein
MKTVVAYESMYGNTRQVAEAIASVLEEFGDVEIVSVNDSDPDAANDADFLVVGGPTHMHGLATEISRKGVAKAAEEDQDVQLEPGAVDGPGLRSWLGQRSGDGSPAAAFDTRIDRSPLLTGSAARGIAKRLRRRGYEVASDPQSFFVEDSEGPLADGELDRARSWGRSLGASLSERTSAVRGRSHPR